MGGASRLAGSPNLIVGKPSTPTSSPERPIRRRRRNSSKQPRVGGVVFICHCSQVKMHRERERGYT